MPTTASPWTCTWEPPPASWTAPAPLPNNHAQTTTKGLGKVHTGRDPPHFLLVTMKERNVSAQSQLARSGSGCAPPPGRGSAGAGTSIYARANLQEVAALTLDRARECGVVPAHGTVDLLLTMGFRSTSWPGTSVKGQIRGSASAHFGKVQEGSRRMRPPNLQRSLAKAPTRPHMPNRGRCVCVFLCAGLYVADGRSDRQFSFVI